ncbi:UNVERIFIED_CONTAM: hypothetical protein K2H54_050347 [Gekko kuhli]
MVMDDLDQSLREAQSSLERDIATLNDLLLNLEFLALPQGGCILFLDKRVPLKDASAVLRCSLDPTSQTEAALNVSEFQLERLRLHLAGPGALGQKLRALQQEAEQQQQRIEAFEKDLEEIQNDRYNLEAILQSLPEGCSSGQ